MESSRNALEDTKRPRGREQGSEDDEQRNPAELSVHVGSVLSPWHRGGVRRQGGLAGTAAGRVSAVVVLVVGPARRRGRVGLVVVLAERRGVVGGGVDVGLLQRRRVEVGPFIWQKVVFVQRLQQRKNINKCFTHSL